MTSGHAGSRLPGRLLVLWWLLLALPSRLRRRRPAAPRNILVLHHLLLGDTVMLAGLFAKLRRVYPDAALRLATPASGLDLFAGRPWGVEAHAFEPRRAATLVALRRLPRPDLVVIPAENRHSLFAAALRARWVVAFEGDRPAWKNWLVDELRPYPQTPAAWPDMVSTLVDGPPPPPFRAGEWPPPAATLTRPRSPYCVLHLGAGSPLRHWLPQRWLAIADWLAARGFTVVWSGGRGEEALVRGCDPDGKYASFAGKLDLSELWQLLAGAALLVSPDTGVAHLGKVAGAPCVTLFGPGSALIYGPGEYFGGLPYRAVTTDPFPCRDGTLLFERSHVRWVKHCARDLTQCAEARCMASLSLAAVREAIVQLLPELRERATPT